MKPPTLLDPPWASLSSLDALELEVMRRSVHSAMFHGGGDGPRIDRYRLLRRVSAGGSGTVYEAAVDRGAARVAIKVIKVTNAREARRIDRELEILSRIAHRRIVRCHGAGTLEYGDRYVVLQWLEGLDLAAFLASHRLRPREALAIAKAAAEGLAVIHGLGVVHRDIKPANLFLADGAIENLRLIDFGLARLQEPDSVVTTSECVLGTPAYMAPEQIRGRLDPTPAVDIFALGAVLFECLTGRRAFRGHDLVSIAAAVLSGDLPAPSTLCEGLPCEVDVLVAAMMAAGPRDRPDADEVVRSLDSLLGLQACA